ncbi:2-amino-4-hydroxy-6-hydroxymethyldihydropteridine diphosphokinase [Endothiovibrio diazotrophicus]
MDAVLTFIGMGGNLGDVPARFERAFQALDALPGSRLAGRSALYRNAPLGPPGQPDYINAVAALETLLEPHALLLELQRIEAVEGRVRETRWGPRTLDLDLLLYGDRRIDDPQLTVPHRGLPERAFVLYPLRDVAPELVIPGLGALQRLIERCPSWRIERLEGGGNG